MSRMVCCLLQLLTRYVKENCHLKVAFVSDAIICEFGGFDEAQIVAGRGLLNGAGGGYGNDTVFVGKDR